MDEEAGLGWLASQTLGCIAPALCLPWILDIDVTVKPLYDRQKGAAVGYNPQQPDRPSHVYLWGRMGGQWWCGFYNP